MRCRRCNSFRLLKLDSIEPEDNLIYRCQECGFLFSPRVEARPSGEGKKERKS